MVAYAIGAMVRPGREVAHSIVELAGKRYLVRVFVDLDRNPVEGVTASTNIGEGNHEDRL
jgi:hypothetical protein